MFLIITFISMFWLAFWIIKETPDPPKTWSIECNDLPHANTDGMATEHDFRKLNAKEEKETRKDFDGLGLA